MSSPFVENPGRAVHVIGPINFDLLGKLTGTVTQFRAAPSAPVTVYIDSPGGSTYCADALLNMLRAPTQSGKRLQITTVVTTEAASAAADLLIAGDYAIAFPMSRVHYHGTRRSVEDVTMETAHQIAGDLQSANERFALRLARKVVARLLFLFSLYRQEAVKEGIAASTDSPVEILAKLLSHHLKRVQPQQVSIIADARQMLRQTCDLVKSVAAKLDSTGKEPPANFEAAVLHAILNYELGRSDRDDRWSLIRGGLEELRQDFQQFSDFLTGEHRKHLDHLMLDYGYVMLNEEELKEYNGMDRATNEAAEWLKEHAEERMEEFWYFVLCLGRRLQRGENVLVAKAAYWLGLVDEVLGSRLPCMRQLVEESAAPSASAGA